MSGCPEVMDEGKKLFTNSVRGQNNSENAIVVHYLF